MNTDFSPQRTQGLCRAGRPAEEAAEVGRGGGGVEPAVLGGDAPTRFLGRELQGGAHGAREGARGQLVDHALPGVGFGLDAPMDDEQAALEFFQRALEAAVLARGGEAERVAQGERGLGAVAEELFADGAGLDRKSVV